MMTLLMAGLSVLAFLALLLRRYRFAALAVAVLIVAFVAFGLGVGTRAALDHLQDPVAARQPPPWCPRNALILLGAGNVLTPDGQVAPTMAGLARIEGAARAYRDCAAQGRLCRLVVSGGDPAGLGQSEAAVYARHLQSLGVPENDLIIEGNSLNTWQNAQFSVPLVEGLAVNRAFLLTAATHMPRADRYFRHFGLAADWWPTNYHVASASPFRMGFNLALMDLWFHERVGWWRYDVYNLLGRNAPPRPLLTLTDPQACPN